MDTRVRCAIRAGAERGMRANMRARCERSAGPVPFESFRAGYVSRPLASQCAAELLEARSRRRPLPGERRKDEPPQTQIPQLGRTCAPACAVFVRTEDGGRAGRGLRLSPQGPDPRGRSLGRAVSRSPFGPRGHPFQRSGDGTLAHGAVVSPVRLRRIPRCATAPVQGIWFGTRSGHAVQT